MFTEEASVRMEESQENSQPSSEGSEGVAAFSKQKNVSTPFSWVDCFLPFSSEFRSTRKPTSLKKSSYSSSLSASSSEPCSALSASLSSSAVFSSSPPPSSLPPTPAPPPSCLPPSSSPTPSSPHLPHPSFPPTSTPPPDSPSISSRQEGGTEGSSASSSRECQENGLKPASSIGFELNTLNASEGSLSSSAVCVALQLAAPSLTEESSSSLSSIRRDSSSSEDATVEAEKRRCSDAEIASKDYLLPAEAESHEFLQNVCVSSGASSLRFPPSSTLPFPAASSAPSHSASPSSAPSSSPPAYSPLSCSNPPSSANPSSSPTFYSLSQPASSTELSLSTSASSSLSSTAIYTATPSRSAVALPPSSSTQAGMLPLNGILSSRVLHEIAGDYTHSSSSSHTSLSSLSSSVRTPLLPLEASPERRASANFPVEPKEFGVLEHMVAEEGSVGDSLCSVVESAESGVNESLAHTPHIRTKPSVQPRRGIFASLFDEEKSGDLPLNSVNTLVEAQFRPGSWKCALPPSLTYCDSVASSTSFNQPEPSVEDYPSSCLRNFSAEDTIGGIEKVGAFVSEENSFFRRPFCLSFNFEDETLNDASTNAADNTGEEASSPMRKLGNSIQRLFNDATSYNALDGVVAEALELHRELLNVYDIKASLKSFKRRCDETESTKHEEAVPPVDMSTALTAAIEAGDGDISEDEDDYSEDIKVEQIYRELMIKQKLKAAVEAIESEAAMSEDKGGYPLLLHTRAAYGLIKPISDVICQSKELEAMILSPDAAVAKNIELEIKALMLCLLSATGSIESSSRNFDKESSPLNGGSSSIYSDFSIIKKFALFDALTKLQSSPQTPAFSENSSGFPASTSLPEQHILKSLISLNDENPTVGVEVLHYLGDILKSLKGVSSDSITPTKLMEVFLNTVGNRVHSPLGAATSSTPLPEPPNALHTHTPVETVVSAAETPSVERNIAPSPATSSSSKSKKATGQVTAFTLFARNKRMELTASGKGFGNTISEQSSVIAGYWRALTQEEKNVWLEKAALQNTDVHGMKLSKRRRPGRGYTAFTVFAKEKRAECKAKDVSMGDSLQEQNAYVAKIWHTFNKDEKTVFQEKSRLLNAQRNKGQRTEEATPKLDAPPNSTLHPQQPTPNKVPITPNVDPPLPLPVSPITPSLEKQHLLPSSSATFDSKNELSSEGSVGGGGGGGGGSANDSAGSKHKRPLDSRRGFTAFTLYQQHKRLEMKEMGKEFDGSFRELTSYVSTCWRALSNSERQQWTKRAREANEARLETGADLGGSTQQESMRKPFFSPRKRNRTASKPSQDLQNTPSQQFSPPYMRSLDSHPSSVSETSTISMGRGVTTAPQMVRGPSPPPQSNPPGVDFDPSGGQYSSHDSAVNLMRPHPSMNRYALPSWSQSNMALSPQHTQNPNPPPAAFMATPSRLGLSSNDINMLHHSMAASSGGNSLLAKLRNPTAVGGGRGGVMGNPSTNLPPPYRGGVVQPEAEVSKHSSGGGDVRPAPPFSPLQWSMMMQQQGVNPGGSSSLLMPNNTTAPPVGGGGNPAAYLSHHPRSHLPHPQQFTPVYDMLPHNSNNNGFMMNYFFNYKNTLGGGMSPFYQGHQMHLSPTQSPMEQHMHEEVTNPPSSTYAQPVAMMEGSGLSASNSEDDVQLPVMNQSFQSEMKHSSTLRILRRGRSDGKAAKESQAPVEASPSLKRSSPTIALRKYFTRSQSAIEAASVLKPLDVCARTIGDVESSSSMEDRLGADSDSAAAMTAVCEGLPTFDALLDSQRALADISHTLNDETTKHTVEESLEDAEKDRENNVSSKAVEDEETPLPDENINFNAEKPSKNKLSKARIVRVSTLKRKELAIRASDYATDVGQLLPEGEVSSDFTRNRKREDTLWAIIKRNRGKRAVSKGSAKSSKAGEEAASSMQKGHPMDSLFSSVGGAALESDRDPILALLNSDTNADSFYKAQSASSVDAEVKGSSFSLFDNLTRSSGPKIKLDEKGNFIVENSSSLENENSSFNDFQFLIEGRRRINENMAHSQIQAYAGAYKRTRSIRWTDHNNDRFYKALETFGADLMMVRRALPEYSDKQIRDKFKVEGKRNAKRIEQALKRKVDMEAVRKQLKGFPSLSKDTSPSVCSTRCDDEFQASSPSHTDGSAFEENRTHQLLCLTSTPQSKALPHHPADSLAFSGELMSGEQFVENILMSSQPFEGSATVPPGSDYTMRDSSACVLSDKPSISEDGKLELQLQSLLQFDKQLSSSYDYRAADMFSV